MGRNFFDDGDVFVHAAAGSSAAAGAGAVAAAAAASEDVLLRLLPSSCTEPGGAGPPGLRLRSPARRVVGGHGRRCLRDVYDDVSSLLGHFASVRLCVERATLAQRTLKSETRLVIG
jgi:HPt (histidine-containing phosphotransfer) domain-containing protein